MAASKRFKGAAAYFASAQIGGQAVPLEGTFTLAVGVNQILAPDPERVVAAFVNNGNAEVWIGFSASIAVGSGILLPPNGGFLALTLVEDYNLVSFPIYAVESASGSDLYYVTARREAVEIEY